nr:hypothetical protein [Kofleriaceae bacterium]
MTTGHGQAPKGQMSFEVRCPKCGRARTGEPACPSCGLLADRMSAFAASRDTAVSPGLLAAWERATSRWDDRTAHDDVFERTTAAREFAWTAARYREIARDKPIDDPVATEAMVRLRRAAEATLVATTATTARADKASGAYRGTMAILLIMVVAVVGLIIYQFVRSNQAPAGTGSGDADPPAGEVR